MSWANRSQHSSEELAAFTPYSTPVPGALVSQAGRSGEVKGKQVASAVVSKVLPMVRVSMPSGWQASQPAKARNVAGAVVSSRDSAMARTEATSSARVSSSGP